MTVALAVVLTLTVLVGTSVPGILAPPVGADAGTGPVLVLGGDGSRLEAALALPGVPSATRELVLSSSAGELFVLAGRSCDEPHVTCVAPVPENTYGEALVAADLAAARDWDALTVVTSTFHVQRVRWQFARCAPGLAVTVVAAPSPGGEALVAWRVVRETLALAQARLRYTCG